MTEWARPIVVDAHCHAGHGDGLTGPWDTDASLDRYRWRARAAGIDRTVLMAALTSDYRTANREVGALVRACPRRYLGYAFVNPVGDRGRIGALVDEARTWGACGIKVHWRDGRITREVAEVAGAGACRCSTTRAATWPRSRWPPRPIPTWRG